MGIDAGRSLLIVAAVALTTIGLRAAPFALFPAHKKTPELILYLGRVLPPAIMGALIVYCLKDTAVTSFPYGLPELAALLTVIFLHLRKRNTLLSIGAGTVVYMLLVRFL